jgi:hypothetical protein
MVSVHGPPFPLWHRTREEFIAWCVAADPAYGGDAKSVGRHWDSLEWRKQANVQTGFSRDQRVQ